MIRAEEEHLSPGYAGQWTRTGGRMWSAYPPRSQDAHGEQEQPPPLPKGPSSPNLGLSAESRHT